VLLGGNDTGGEYFSVEVLMRKEAYGAVRGEYIVVVLNTS
jgi:hypothetical protein